MSLPVQVWNSYFWKSPYDSSHARDLRRAESEWQGEERVWLDPKAEKVTRWTIVDDQGLKIRQCVIPSENINCFIVSHIDSLGRVYPYFPLPKEWHGSVSGCYGRWVQEPALIYLINSDTVRMPMPLIKDGSVTYVDATFKIAPGPVSSSLNVKDDGTFNLAFKKKGNAKMLAMNLELEDEQGSKRYSKEEINGREYLTVVSDKDTSIKALSHDIGWNEPFRYMLGEGGGIELMAHQGYIKNCIHDVQEGRLAKVLKNVESWLSVFTTPGQIPIWYSWFAPLARENSDEALFAIESQYDISANSIEELYKSEKFCQVMNTKTSAIVAHDWVGYFWWDFYQDLKEMKTIRCCEACGQLIRGGRQDRRFCSHSENPECFRKRNAISQRKTRTSKS